MQILTTYMVWKKYGRFRIKLKDLKGFRSLFGESLGLGIDFIIYDILIDGSIIILAFFAPDNVVGNFRGMRDAGINIFRIIVLLLGTMLLSTIPSYLKKFEYDTVEKMTGYVTKINLYFFVYYHAGNVYNSRSLYQSF
ncbi:MAG: hypothetical protein JW776_11145 [Candidatus Lokiarchaeota archaeon]|nr:hypothetical protein [Candidatus Lokiarchaeota archaeon]